MEAAIWIYLYLVVGKLEWVVWILGCAGLTSACFWLMVAMDGIPEDESFGVFTRWTKRCVAAAFCVAVLATLYPNREDLAWIFGGAAAYSISQNEEAQKLPDNVLKAVNTFLEGIAAEEPKQ